MNYEDAMKELEDIIQKLESGNVNFDEATSLYSRGAELCVFLSERFKETKGKITKIVNTLENLLEEDFN